MSDFIRDHWDRQAVEHGTSPAASWGDDHAIQLEIATVGKHLADGQDVLDVGCANGHSAFEQHLRHRLRSLVGVDYSSQMIHAAKSAKAARGVDGVISFQEADIRSLPFPEGTFDVVYTTRVLINLPTWEEQVRGIEECLRVARSGGKVVLCEAFWEPLQLLNAMRALCALPPLVEHDFNRYLKGPRLEEWLRSRKLSFTVDRFSSVYYLGSRLLRELVTNPADYPGYSNPINRLFYEIEVAYSGGGFGIQQAYVVSKP